MAERIKKVLSKFLSVIRPLIRILAGGGEHINQKLNEKIIKPSENPFRVYLFYPFHFIYNPWRLHLWLFVVILRSSMFLYLIQDLSQSHVSKIQSQSVFRDQDPDGEIENSGKTFFLKSTGTNTRFLELKLVFRHIVGLNLKYRLGHGPCQTVTSENLETRNSVSVNLRLEHKFGQTSCARISVSIRVHSSRDKQFISLVNCVTIKNPEIIAILK